MGESGQPTGVLATADGIGSNAREVALEIGAARLSRSTRFTADVTLAQYARVSYLDELGAHHVDFFMVDPVSGGTVISQAVGSRAFTTWDAGINGKGPLFDLDTLTPRKLLKYIESHR